MTEKGCSSRFSNANQTAQKAEVGRIVCDPGDPELSPSFSSSVRIAGHQLGTQKIASNSSTNILEGYIWNYMTARIARCPDCTSINLRRSQIQTSDLNRLALLMLVVRCRKCGYRFFCWRWEKGRKAKTNGELTATCLRYTVASHGRKVFPKAGFKPARLWCPQCPAGTGFCAGGIRKVCVLGLPSERPSVRRCPARETLLENRLFCEVYYCVKFQTEPLPNH